MKEINEKFQARENGSKPVRRHKKQSIYFFDEGKRVDYSKNADKLLLEGDRATIMQKVGKTTILHSMVTKKDETTSPFRSGTNSSAE